jgi:predicted component of type VI protein secretion system
VPQVFVLSGPDAGRSFTVRSGSSVGRSSQCDVRLREGSISRNHAHFELVDDHWWIVDDGSRNGVLLGGAKVTRAELADHAEFHLGELLLRFRLDDTESPAAPAPVPAATPGAADEIVLEGDPEDVEFAAEVPPVVKAKRHPSSVIETILSPPPTHPGAGGRPAAAADARGGVLQPSPPADPGTSGRPAAAVDVRGGVLQYHKAPERSGLAVTDLTQYPAWARWLVYALVLAAAAGLSYLAFRGTSSMREKLGTPSEAEAR